MFSSRVDHEIVTIQLGRLSNLIGGHYWESHLPSLRSLSLDETSISDFTPFPDEISDPPSSSSTGTEILRFWHCQSRKMVPRLIALDTNLSAAGLVHSTFTNKQKQKVKQTSTPYGHVEGYSPMSLQDVQTWNQKIKVHQKPPSIFDKRDEKYRYRIPLDPHSVIQMESNFNQAPCNSLIYLFIINMYRNPLTITYYLLAHSLVPLVFMLFIIEVVLDDESKHVDYGKKRCISGDHVGASFLDWNEAVNWIDSSSGIDFDDALRKQLEQCDHVEALHLNTGTGKQWGAIALGVVRKWIDEAPKRPILIFNIQGILLIIHLFTCL